MTDEAKAELHLTAKAKGETVSDYVRGLIERDDKREGKKR